MTVTATLPTALPVSPKSRARRGKPLRTIERELATLLTELVPGAFETDLVHPWNRVGDPLPQRSDDMAVPAWLLKYRRAVAELLLPLTGPASLEGGPTATDIILAFW